ncbi:hypothetical protein ACFX13_004362 [Malus domestica]
MEFQSVSSNSVLERDSSVVLAAMNRSEDDCSLLGPIIIDIKGALRSMEGTSLNFVHREANNVAHRLARAGLGVSSEDRWVESPPVFILDALLEDNQV